MASQDRAAMRSIHVAASVAERDGGATTAVLKTVRALNDIGDNALILATTADGPHGHLQRQTSDPVMEGEAPVWFCRRSRPRLLKNSWQQALRTVREARHASIMHVHGVYLANSIWAYLASRMIGTPYVLQPHGTLEPYQEAQNRRRKSVFNRLIGQRILAGASALVATSTAEASNLRMAQPGATVVVIPLGAAAADPSPTMTADAVPWRAVPRESRVIFLGRFAAKKRLDVLLDAWNRLDVPGHLVLAGPEEDWTWPDLRGRLGHTRTPTVTYLGTLDEFGVAWALEQCGTLVLPSENENFGLVVPEAMIHGCAVLTTIQTASSEHVRTAAAGIVLEEPTIESVTQALRLLLTSPDRVRLMGQAAQTHARASLTWEASALRLKDLYASTRTKGN